MMNMVPVGLEGIFINLNKNNLNMSKPGIDSITNISSGLKAFS